MQSLSLKVDTGQLKFGLSREPIETAACAEVIQFGRSTVSPAPDNKPNAWHDSNSAAAEFRDCGHAASLFQRHCKYASHVEDSEYI